MTTESWVLSHFKVARQSGIEWPVHCPTHEDNNPSASVNIKKRVINCQKCGGKSLYKLAQEKGWDLPPGSYEKKAVSNQEIARYDYKDESGKVLYQQIRYLQPNGEKTFRGYNPENNTWKLEGVRRVPYRFPELLLGIEERKHIFIAEGEKDVETLITWGLCATTNSNGARSTKIWNEFAKYFQCGTMVYICPDADIDGKKHAETIKEILTRKQCRVKILNFGYPIEEKHGKDVTDWKAEGHTCDDLVMLLDDQKDNDESEDMPEAERDWGHACCLAPFYLGRFRYALHRKMWHEYTGKVWEIINDEKLSCLSTRYLIDFYYAKVQEAMGLFDKDLLKRYMKAWREAQQFNKVQGAINYLKGWDGIRTQYFEWDKHPWLFNVQNGTIDLKSGLLHDHESDQLLTQISPVNYEKETEAGLWNAHLEKFIASPDVRREIQRNLGMSLCGAKNAEIFPIWFGAGANGKSTTIKAIQNVMGNYVIKAAPDILIASKFEKHPAEIADLCGARLIFSVETDDAKRLAEAKVKELTGGDTLKARKMYGDFFQFEPTWTIFLLTNHKPIIRGTDHAIWRRVRLIPWTIKINDKEKLPQDEVIKYLMEEAPAILNWLLAGLRDSLENPFWMAAEVRAATDDYRHDQDSLSGFFDECCEIGKTLSCGSGELYSAFVCYCERLDEKPFAHKTFSKCLKERDFELVMKRINGVMTRCVSGLRLRSGNVDQFEPEPDFFTEV